MELLSERLDYWVTFVFGLIAVAVHAYSLYGQPSQTRIGETSDTLLGSISIAVLSSRRHFYRGFAFYLAASEVIYTVLALSSGILVLSLTVLGRSDLAGALSGGVEFDPLIPLAASTAFIAATQIKPVAVVEQSFRRIAHALAGVPDTVYDSRRAITSALDDALERRRRPADTEPAGDASARGNGDADRDARIVDDATTKAALVWRAPATVLDKAERRALHESILKVYCLHAWTLGSEGDQIWIGEQSDQVLALVDAPADEEAFQELDTNLEQAMLERSTPVAGGGASATSTPAEQERATRRRWEQIVRRSETLEKKLTLTLTLLFLSRPDAKLRQYRMLLELQSASVVDRPKAALDSHVTALAIGAALALFLTTLYFVAKDDVKTRVRWQIDAAELGPAHATNLAPPSLWSTLADELRGSDGLSDQTRGRVDAVLSGTSRAWGAELKEALWEVLNYLVVFGIATSVALVVLRTRWQENRWRMPNAARPLPVLTYVGLGLLAYAFVTGAYLTINFLRLAVWSAYLTGLPVFSSINLDTFLAELPRLMVFPLVALARIDAGPLAYGSVAAFAAAAAILAWQASAVAPSRVRVRRAARAAIALGAGIGLFNLLVRSILQTIPNGWELADVLVQPTLGFGAFAFCFVVCDPIGHLFSESPDGVEPEPEPESEPKPKPESRPEPEPEGQGESSDRTRTDAAGTAGSGTRDRLPEPA